MSKAYLLCRMLLSIAKLTLEAGAPFASCDLLLNLSAGCMQSLCFLIGYNVFLCLFPLAYRIKRGVPVNETGIPSKLSGFLVSYN